MFVTFEITSSFDGFSITPYFMSNDIQPNMTSTMMNSGSQCLFTCIIGRNYSLDRIGLCYTSHESPYDLHNVAVVSTFGALKTMAVT